MGHSGLLSLNLLVLEKRKDTLEGDLLAGCFWMA